jgi:hypothetical protein
VVETLPETSGVGSVVLDIGGCVGAATVYVPAALAGAEIEIRAADEAWRGTHVAVRERALPDRAVWAAVFPALEEGSYEIRVREREPCGPTASVVVSGGRVTTLSWTDAG